MEDNLLSKSTATHSAHMQTHTERERINVDRLKEVDSKQN